jgi:hypothetical protein
VSLFKEGALQTCGVKAYRAVTDQRLYFSFGRLFLGETVYYTENSTYTELEPYVRGCVRCYYYDYICYYYDRD